MDTQITVVGNLVADPRLSFLSNGQPKTSFRIASTPRRFDRATGEWRDGDTLYANVTCWRGLAENVAGSLKKGQSAIVMGRLSVRPYETKEGEKRQSVDIDAMVVGPDLSRVMTVVKRAERAIVPPVAQSAGGIATAESSATDRLIDGANVADSDFADAGFAADLGDDLDDLDGELADELVDELGVAGSADDAGADDGSPVGAGGRLKARLGLG